MSKEKRKNGLIWVLLDDGTKVAAYQSKCKTKLFPLIYKSEVRAELALFPYLENGYQSTILRKGNSFFIKIHE